jgi:hypothetical protein
VLLGKGAVEHEAKLSRFASEFGVDSAELAATVEQLEADPDTYFLSAEGHNRWRGGMTYDEFPMRRCVSVHFCVNAAATAPT